MAPDTPPGRTGSRPFLRNRIWKTGGLGLPSLLALAVITTGLPATSGVMLANLGSRAEPGRMEPPGAPLFRLVPDLTIGSEDSPEYALSWITAVAVDSLGTMYVAQPREGTIRVYSPNGHYLHKLGTKGEGPGEFRSVTEMGWLADTLWVLDTRLRRLTLFPGGEEAELATLPLHLELGFPYLPGTAFALLADGTALLRPELGIAEFIAGSANRVPILRIGRDLQVRDTVSWQPISFHSRLLLRTEDGGFLVSSNQPFDDSPLFRVEPNGRAIVRVERRVANEKGAGLFRVTRMSPGGKVLWSRRFQYVPESVRSNVQDSVVAALAERFSSQFRNPDAARKAVREGLFLPAVAPPVTDCLVGYDGTVWLRRDVFASDGTEWTVLDPDGRILLEARTIGPARLLAANGHQAWGVEYDELDVPHLVRYRLERISD